MRRCLTLAANGLGRVAPNPLVGAVLALDDKILSEGFHRSFGGPHAEVNALAAYGDKPIPDGATLYVNLEPCSHHGKTPPCADLIIARGIKKVAVGQKDPNPLVSGRGIEKLRAAGILVESGILESEALFLNRRFNTFHTKKRPYIVLKWAESEDGFMDRNRDDHTPGVNWISHPETKKLVHRWRSCEAGILVGRNTIVNDDPSLTVREVYGKSPQRIAIATSGEIPKKARVCTDGQGIWIYNHKVNKEDGENRWIRVSGKDFLVGVLSDIYEQNIGSVMVEGGAATIKSFLEAGLWDETRVIKSPVKLGSGLRAPAINQSPANVYNCGRDRIEEYFSL